MLNQVSRKFLSKYFSRNQQFGRNQKPYLSRTIKFYLFNSGKYDLNKDYYGVLGLSKQADQPTIKKEYYKLAKQYHPDVNPAASEKIKLINEAYSVLSDEKLKAEYDEARQVNQTQEKFYQKRQQYQDSNEYRAHYYKQYQKAYEQMSQYERYLMKKTFNRMMTRVFLFGFVFTLFFITIFGGPRRVLVDQYGRPVDINGRPIDIYGKPIVYQSQPPIYDPYNLGGPPKGTYPYQNMYGRQYAAGVPGSPQGQGYM